MIVGGRIVLRGRFIALLLVLLPVLAYAQATEENGTAIQQRISKLISTIKIDVSLVEGMRDRAQKEGAAIRLSCIEEKLRGLRANLSTTRSLQTTFVSENASQAYLRRTILRVDVLEVYASSFTEEARACTDAKELEFKLEVIAPPSLTAEPPPWSIATPPTFERPPLASPF